MSRRNKGRNAPARRNVGSSLEAGLSRIARSSPGASRPLCESRRPEHQDAAGDHVEPGRVSARTPHRQHPAPHGCADLVPDIPADQDRSIGHAPLAACDRPLRRDRRHPLIWIKPPCISRSDPVAGIALDPDRPAGHLPRRGDGPRCLMTDLPAGHPEADEMDPAQVALRNRSGHRSDRPRRRTARPSGPCGCRGDSSRSISASDFSEPVRRDPFELDRNRVFGL